MTGPALVHLGVVYDSTQDLVAALAPPIRRAPDRGDAVCLMVDRGVRRLVHDEFGPAAEAIRFPAPADMFRPDAWTFLDHVRSWGASGRGALVIGQYTAFAVDDEACAAAEDGINLLLGDVAVTLVCACARDAGEGMLATARRSHPHLVHDDVPIPNPDFRPPADRSAVPDRVLGLPDLRVTFRDTRDLLRIREHVAVVAREAGIEGDDARAAVLAVHEAVVLACPPQSPHDDESPEPAEPSRVLEVRRFPTALLSEVTGPRPDAVPDGSPVRVDPEDPVRHIRSWCDEVSLYETADVRTIRVVTDPRRRSRARGRAASAGRGRGRAGDAST